ncbi:MAG TPA: hypothetical protein DEQ32_18770 [Gammaproteobacteria bacterium]|nr:hypothetical protein [Gammaproteobacteria bacterium]
MKVWGVDGCPGGWFAVSSDGELSLASDFASLLQRLSSGRLYIDIPIGLPETERRLEGFIRRNKPIRSGSLFSVPCRPAVYADTYECACEINFSLTGKKLSKQSWFLCKKIKEVDDKLRRDDSMRRRVIESHPELAFAILKGSALEFSKKTLAGIQERLTILSTKHSQTEQIYALAVSTYPRKLLGRDDIVDALALLCVGLGKKRRLVVSGQRRDAFGIPIRMIVPDRS